MATPSKIVLTTEDTGIFKFKDQDQETATKVSELLQENHDKHHIFFNKDGFHNHIAHHLLTIYGLGASAADIETAYQKNAGYQRSLGAVEERVLEDMSKPELFQKYLGQEKYYQDFLVFFQNEMDKNGWEQVVNEYLFARDERADDLLGRMYGGFLHPIIHFGFGVEFKQPAIMAEGLAEACVHANWITKYLLQAEAAAKSNAEQTSTTKSLVELLDEIRADKKLSSAAHWEDGNKIRDGLLKRAPEEMVKYASQWVVTPETLEQKTAEMANAAIYFTAAAQHPPKQVKFDFYFMHCTNASIFFPAFNALSFLKVEDKVRLLQWKGYIDLAMYASRASPPLLLEEISLYTPTKLEAGDAEWPGIFRRLITLQDDGHAPKLGRAVAFAEKLCKPYEEAGKDVGKLNGFMWEKIGNMVVDSVEDTGDTWARSVGFEQAWEKYEDRPRSDVVENTLESRAGTELESAV